MNQQTISLAIVDDEHLIRSLLTTYFQQQDNVEILLTASSGENFLEQLSASNSPRPDVVLMDLRMKKLDGTETTQKLHELSPSSKVIIISSHYKASFIGYMLKTGVNAFLPKGIMPQELLNIVQQVYKSGYYFLPEQVETMRTQITPKAPKPIFDVEASITAREREILVLICQQYTAQEIADKLFLAKRTVEGHKNKLFSKLDVKNMAGLVIYAIQNKIIDINNL